METKDASLLPEEAQSNKKRSRRRAAARSRRVRYFLPQMGSTTERPELGLELASEGEALLEAIKAGQLFYTLEAWQALPTIKNQNATIVKRPFSRG